MLSPHIVLLTTLYFLSVISSSQCNENLTTPNNTKASISKISYSTTGGRSGNYESVNISADSLIYIQARRGNEKTINEKTEKDFWNSLTRAINLEDFDKIKSNPGHALYDGIDITISIETMEKKHFIVNGNEDTVNYKRIEPFTDMLAKKLEELGKKIIWNQ